MNNNRGSFTVEASILFAMIFLIVFTFLSHYLYQYVFYHYRGLRLVNESPTTMTHNGLYMDEYTQEKEVLFMNQSHKLVHYKKQLNYLPCVHHYMIGKDLKEAAGEFLENY